MVKKADLGLPRTVAVGCTDAWAMWPPQTSVGSSTRGVVTVEVKQRYVTGFLLD